MTITLTPEQQKWVEAAVSAGRFASIEDAVRFAVDHLFAPVDTEDLSWAKPYIEEARAEIAQGKYVTHDEFKKEISERIKSLR